MHDCHEPLIYLYNQPHDTWAWENFMFIVACVYEKFSLYMQLCEQIARHSM